MLACIKVGCMLHDASVVAIVENEKRASVLAAVYPCVIIAYVVILFI